MGDRVSVIDAFTFRNELDLLEVRLHELSDAVDWFVLVEADFTFQGGTKPFVFQENRERFAPFLHRIMRVEMTGPVEADDPWGRESLQRYGMLEGLKGIDAEPDDVVLLSDVDEIPRPGAIDIAARRLADGAPQISFNQRLCFYAVDNICYTQIWRGTQAVKASEMFRRMPQDVREARGTAEDLPDGGWHWCNMGDPEWLIEKIESFSHDEVNLPQYKRPEFLAQCIKEGREMTGRTDILFRREDPATLSLPKYLTENRERFAHLFSEVKS